MRAMLRRFSEIPPENDDPLRDDEATPNSAGKTLTGDEVAKRRLEEARLEAEGKKSEQRVERLKEQTRSDPTGRNLYRTADEAAQARISEEEERQHRLAEIKKGILGS